MPERYTIRLVAYLLPLCIEADAKSLPDTQAGKVVGDLMTIRCTGEGDFVFGLGHIHWGRDMIGEATVLIKVDDQ